MSTTTTAPAATIVPNAPDGIVRVFVPNGLELSKLELRTLAQKAAGTIDVGRTPAGKPAKLNGVQGHGYDFAPVKRGGTVKAAATPVKVSQSSDDPRVAALKALGLSDEQVAAALAAAPAPKAQAAPKAPKKDREVPAFLRRWENVTCKTCRDFGKVRGPGAGEKAGRPFRTQHGADSAPTAVPCPSHASGKSGKKGRKGA